MPTYEYECQACKHRFEQFQSIKSDPIRTCPKCHKRKVHRLISGGGGFIFKGSGFYVTDYRSDSYKQAAAKDSGSASTPSTAGASDSKSESKSESKSASKPESKSESTPAASKPARKPGAKAAE